MKLVRLPASRSGPAYAHFEKTVLQPVPASKLRRSMTMADQTEFARSGLSDHASGVRALALTPEAKNGPIRATMSIGDEAVFYTDKRFTHRAAITFKWRSDTLQDICGLEAALGQCEIFARIFGWSVGSLRPELPRLLRAPRL